MRSMSVSKLLALVVGLVLSMVAAPAALGQQQLRLQPIPDGNIEQPASAVADLHQLGSGNGYWFVSTRRCPRKGELRSVVCPVEYFQVSDAGRLRGADRQSFQRSLQPGVPVCVVVHGSFVDWATIRTDAHQIYHWIRRGEPNRPLQVVFYTWPSEGFITMLPHVDVAILGRRSGMHGLHLARWMSTVSPDHPICLLGHSHGARTVASALHLLGGGCVQNCRLDRADGGQRRLRAVLAAAAFDHHWLNAGERYGRALGPVERLLNLQNRRDLPLAAYPFRKLFSRRALARSGFTRQDLIRIGWQAGKISEADVTHLVDTGHMWPNYNRRPEIASVIAPYVYFVDARDKARNVSRGNNQVQYTPPVPTSGAFKRSPALKMRERP